MTTAEHLEATPPAPHVEAVANFLVVDPPPVRRPDLPAWEQRVRTELGAAALPTLVELLEVGSPGEQYAAMAAARVLGAEVWATDREPNLAWKVTLPGARRAKLIRPRRQAMPG
jgi:hypothetical protein